MNSSLFSHHPQIETILRSQSHHLSGFSFSNIFLWSDFFEFRFEEIERYLCVFARNDIGMFLYLPPLKKGISGDLLKRDLSERGRFSSAVAECFFIMEKENRAPRISRIENVEADYLEFFPKEEFEVSKRGSEYGYLREDIEHLKGNRFKSKRAAYNQFVKRHACEFKAFEKTMAPECEWLYSQWEKNRLDKHRDDVYNHMLFENRSVHQLAMRHFEDLGLIGRVVVADGKICAYTFGYPLNAQTFCVLFEITDLTMNGLAVYVFREFCRDARVRPYRFINAMDDFGMENIGRVKMSFRPAVLWPAYAVMKAIK